MILSDLDCLESQFHKCIRGVFTLTYSIIESMRIVFTSNVFGAQRHVYVQQLLDRQGEALLVAHHGDVVQAIEVGQRLHVGLVFDQFLRAAVQKTDMRIGAEDDLAVQLQNQPEHAVSGRMLRAEVKPHILYGLLRQGIHCQGGLLLRRCPIEALHGVRHRSLELLEEFLIRVPLVAAILAAKHKCCQSGQSYQRTERLCRYITHVRD